MADATYKENLGMEEYSDKEPWDKCGYTVEKLGDKTPGVASCHLPKQSILSINSALNEDLTKKHKESDY